MSAALHVVQPNPDLEALIRVACKAADEARAAISFDSVESRRERFLAYGRALLPIREQIPQKNAFNAYVKAHGLEVSDAQFRSDAMWLARWAKSFKSARDFGKSLSHCPHSQPCDIRQWLRKQKQPDDRASRYSQIIKPTDNWNFYPLAFERLDEDGYGYIPGDIYANCLWYWTKPGDIVVAPMAGSGMIQHVYDRRAEWAKPEPWDLDLRMFDLTPRGPYARHIRENDATKGLPVKHANYIVMDVPYFNIVRNQYSDRADDLANMDLPHWMAALASIANRCRSAQKAGDLCTIVVTNFRDISDGTIVLATRIATTAFEKSRYLLHDVAYAPRRIQQTQSPGMANTNNAAKRSRIMLTDMAEVLTLRAQ
jgi:ParB family chromosome partitioning protein